MARYLVVAHQTAASPGLTSQVVGMAGKDPKTEFVLLVPATPVRQLLRRRGSGAAEQVARRQADRAQAAFAAAGVRLSAARVGAADPLQAVGQELQAHGSYDGVIVSTLPAEQSRWLRMDLPGRVERELHVPVIHVEVTLGDVQAVFGELP